MLILSLFLLAILIVSTQVFAGPVYALGKGTPQPVATAIPRSDNLFYNGSFEFGFYPIPELGFEAPDIGNIPHAWNWYRNSTYGKYDIDNNTNFQLVCPEDDILNTGSRNALGIYIQSTDQPDARLGIYQTVDVIPGQDYVFSISGTIQIQKHASSPDINHKVMLAFDHTGGTDWSAIPDEAWILLPWAEQKLEFKTSGPDDPDLAKVEDYYTLVKARSNKMTVFIGAWRRWPNWRSAVFTFDCASLLPLNKVDDLPALVARLSELSTTDVDKALGASVIQVQPATDTITTTVPTATPASQAPTEPTATPRKEPAEIPDSGGVLESKDNTLIIVIVAVVVIAGLVGAGVWNIQRQKRRN
ncbi:MAG: hypothetical protein JXM69_04585 [Anaerolineae bacterium]|nr:hypothetical protein [Anaerolineae bacterium]